MKVTIETFLIPYTAKVTEVYLRLINTILLADNENSLREAIEKLKSSVPLDDYFEYGFGLHHLWVHQRKINDRTQCFKSRLMIAEF